MGSLMILKNLMLEMDCNRMLSEAAGRDKLTTEQAIDKIEELLSPLSEFASKLPSGDISGLKVYREHIGESMWEGLASNPKIVDMAKAHIRSLIAPELAKVFEVLKVWVNNPEFTQEHFNIIFEV